MCSDRPDEGDILALVEAARPGPFARRTPVLGRYVGVRDARTGRLVAMGGERFRLDGHVELSAIAVSPEARGRGLGAAVTASLARAAHRRGDVPFLHVYAANGARPLYGRLGFRKRTELWVLLWRRGART
ncbi:GNAT family N-acetyltransferase [Methylobacterium nodulans]|uniref:GNAT family N-acetyltransferase n=1 Tax=Methylobacterium nodulans TaxID=114616 RepID=UPI0001619A83|nr:GNAT family N-acetyltransferase [Methylobacterium nodulans]